MEGVETTSASVTTTPVRTAPAAPPPPALPTRSLVAYAHGITTPSADGTETLRLLASQVAAAGLRNRRAGVSLPRVAVTGYGADARRDEQAAAPGGAHRPRGPCSGGCWPAPSRTSSRTCPPADRA